MCNGWGVPGNRTMGRGKIGSSRAIRKYYTGKAKARRTDAQGRTAKRGQEKVDFLTPHTVHPCCVCASSFCRSSGGSPKALERPAVGRLAQLLERPFSDLPDSLPGDAHERSDLLERHGLAALLETVVEVEDLALTRGQELLEDAVDELAHQLAVRLLLDLPALLPCEALAQRGCAFVAPVDRGIERQLGRRHAARGAHVLDRVLERHRDLVVGRLAAELLREVGVGPAHAG